MKRRSSLLVLTALAAGCFAGGAFGADKPNLTGVWTIDLSKSDFGQMPPPSKVEIKWMHKEPEVSTSTLQVTPRGERTTEAKYTTDGKEAEIQLMGQPAKVKAVWEGNSLVVTTKGSFNGNEISIVEKWSLSADGSTLSSDATMNSQMGEMKTTRVFNKAK